MSRRPGLYSKLFSHIRPYGKGIFLLFVLSALAMPVALLSPLPLKIAVDNILGSRPLPPAFSALVPDALEASTSGLLLAAAGLVVAVVLAGQLIEWSSWLLRTRIGEQIALDFRAMLFRKVQRFSIAYHDSKGAFDSTYRIQHDAPSIQYIAIDGVLPLATAFFTLVGMLAVMVRIDWQLSLVALGVIPVLFILSRTASTRIRRYWREMKEQESSAISVVQETLSVMRVVKAFGKEEAQEQRFVSQAGESIKKRFQLILFQGGFDIAVALTIAAGTASVLFIGVHHVERGTLTLGGLLVVMTYLAQLYAPLKTLSNKTTDIQSSLASAERAFALLEEQPDVVEKPHARHLARVRGGITFERVSFGYESARTILSDVSFDVRPGSRIGIVGKTGAGKTTLLGLLMRFFDPTSGRVLLDGEDLREFRLSDLRRQFATVFQEPVLFSTSIAENIAYARPEAREKDIVDAAKAAHADDFIARLPDGYNTKVGERGMRLSGGERQRISLARAFLKDAPILILDEPTSAVDTKTESVIMEAIGRLMAGRTAFMVAHRLSTLAQSDFLLHLDGGRLVTPLAPPTPDELKSFTAHGGS